MRLERGYEMQLEVTLLEWNDHEQGVRLLGRSCDPTLVATVQRHLAKHLQGEIAEPKELRLVKGSPNEPNDDQEEGDNDETS